MHTTYQQLYYYWLQHILSHYSMSFVGIRELLLQSKAFPELVIQIFVAFAVAFPSAMYTCTGSNGHYYGQTLKTYFHFSNFYDTII